MLVHRGIKTIPFNLGHIRVPSKVIVSTRKEWGQNDVAVIPNTLHSLSFRADFYLAHGACILLPHSKPAYLAEGSYRYETFEQSVSAIAEKVYETDEVLSEAMRH